MKFKVAVLVSALLVTGSTLADSVMKAEFHSMQECLSAIKANGGEPLKIIQDKPDMVTGRLPNDKMFACEKKETGSKGTYFEGWFMVKD
ncbi:MULTISPECIES: hypothetical protein [Enterobacterales]|uniref:Uncharacterized protein n=1 Tax=Enterobacter roggenkampii TaxID=1812935 RepID=A0ABY0J9L9_9ENTR|nr:MULTISPECIES: hypothetical protein [Enterobacteriaceae]MDE1509425.1 hypothetical protein [Serratia nevei]WGZ99800.1 hypothetical protein QJQ59_33065 [Klebsiella michiganensis]HCB1583351.1 hypothetical protein [Citrobacter braakii]HDL6664795.1 hypothetical protein [Yersinia enterocolitica]HDN6545059.1 hypothetical protein [Salmonella enterica subsp. enterica serovar Chester]HDU5062368.1 hypothetical protein [Klebsiella pneumoniae subsp. pneumoniae]HEE9942027.1 hypothetical protein [Citroba